MVSKAKLYSRLDLFEEELKEKLTPLLVSATRGENDLVFCVSDFNSLPELRHQTSKETEKLIILARQILSLKEKLGESSEQTIAERICWYCREWSKVDNNLSKKAQSLASAFLEEIKNQH